MKRSITIAGVRFRGDSLLLIFFLLLVLCVQTVPGWGNAYAMYVYPSIARTLSSFSRLIPFAIGDLFIALSIAGVLLYPAYARCIRKRKWSRILLKDVKYLLWVYVWFYLAWGLNYSQKNFYERTRIPYTAYTPENFRSFTDGYIENLNSSYTGITSIDKELVCRESVQAYNQIGDSLGVHRPFHQSPRVKTMLFTPLISMVGVTGSMAPFFCEFTLNGDLLPSQYPATYAHEMAHGLSISNEAEANLYSYLICTSSSVPEIRFSGYFSLLPYVLSNAYVALDKDSFEAWKKRLRPEIKDLYNEKVAYWQSLYSPLIGEAQDVVYNLFLKGNKIPAGTANYSEVIALLIALEGE